MGWAGVASTGSAGVRGFPQGELAAPWGVTEWAPRLRAGPGQAGRLRASQGEGEMEPPTRLSPPLEPLAVHTPSLVCPVTVPTTFLSLTSTW